MCYNYYYVRSGCHEWTNPRKGIVIMKKNSECKKKKAIKRYLDGEKVKQIAGAMKISTSTIYSWIRQYNEKRNSIVNEVTELRKLAERQQKMIEILKMVDCTVSAPLKEKLSAMEKLYGKYNNHLLCETMEVDRGTFLNHIKRSKGENNWYNQRREELKAHIQKLFEENNQIYGSKKITALLRKQYVNVSEEMVRELMNELGLKSVRTTSKKEYIKEKRKKNILKQRFKADSPNRVWVSDVTVFSYGDYYYYICAIIDLFSRKVVAYHISIHNSTQLVKTTMKRAITSRKPSSGLILHTDNGSNFCSKTFENYLKENEVVHSFSRSGTPHDNAVAESFFSSLKQEELYRRKINSEAELYRIIENYINFYNSERLHSANHYKSPDEYEEEYYIK